MRARHSLLGVLGLIAAGSVGLASPATAASGPWSTVSAGDYHTCGINTARSLYCWGFNGHGQIGDGTTGNPDAPDPEGDRHSPTRIGSSGAWASVSAGALNTCAISTGKSLYCWGDNDYGQVGDGTITERNSPKKIGSSGVWAAVELGSSHTCAITTGQSLYCWGHNVGGQLGDRTTTDRHSPTKIGTSGAWATVTAGAFHTCAISTGRSLYCWGGNNKGQLGNGTSTLEPNPNPKRIGSSGVWAAVNGGLGHTCAISTGSSLYCWGYNQGGQVGNGESGIDVNQLTPTRIGSPGVWVSASLGGTHTCATSVGRSLWCWGGNFLGQIGDGTTDSRSTPRRIATPGVWAVVAAGSAHACAVSTGKSLYCWGNNAQGMVGDGTFDNYRPTPTRVL